MMLSVWRVLVVATLSVVFSSHLATTAIADGEACFTCPPEVSAVGAGSGIDVSGASHDGGSSLGGSPSNGTDAATTIAPNGYSFVQRSTVAACSGNSPTGREILCSEVFGTCADSASVRSWMWERIVTVAAGPPRKMTFGAWRRRPGTYCVASPQASAVPLAVRVIAQVQDLFARNRLPLPVARVIARPGPRTLVNLPTRLTAGTAATTELTTSVLGLAVHISARPTTWDWTLAGERLTTSSPTLQQTYLRPGTSPAGVTITWTGTFRIGDDPTQHPLVRPAIVRGVPLILQVLEAHAERVAG